jgi:hypothetical protein
MHMQPSAELLTCVCTGRLLLKLVSAAAAGYYLSITFYLSLGSLFLSS